LTSGKKAAKSIKGGEKDTAEDLTLKEKIKEGVEDVVDTLKAVTSVVGNKIEDAVDKLKGEDKNEVEEKDEEE